MFPFVFSKCQPQWKHIKTAKYKTLQHESVSMVSILYVYIDFLVGLIKNILTNLCKQKHWKPRLPQTFMVLDISDLEDHNAYSHPEPPLT